ncbi:MAG: serine/threonine protein kinase [Polyangiaceae bacterium]|nr:serine/threonine protein kinase [Polyangiaceae bacterium]
MDSNPGDQPGAIVDGKYALVALVGEGGMAQVWRALTYGAHGIRRTVALKRLHEHVAAYPEVVAMFIEEARVGARLRHPNVVQIHDFGVDESGRHYLVTEWVEGIHLGQYLSSTGDQPAPWPIITAVGIEVLRALDAAHTSRDERGDISPVLHRDVSPPNILLDVIGVTKLADFGMARAMDRGRITQPDMVKGKLSYLAPEMARGEDPTPESDLYSLGIVLWEAYTGTRLFDGASDVEVIRRVQDPRVPLLASRAPHLPLGLSMTIQRALERERERRFPSAAEMLEALRQVLRAHPASTWGNPLGQAVEVARQRLRAGIARN